VAVRLRATRPGHPGAPAGDVPGRGVDGPGDGALAKFADEFGSSHADGPVIDAGKVVRCFVVDGNDASKSFEYFHDGVWKTGFHDPLSRLFIGTANGDITTVIGNASRNYIKNLMAAQP
jgi:hypothetical protein